MVNTELSVETGTKHILAIDERALLSSFLCTGSRIMATFVFILIRANKEPYVERQSRSPQSENTRASYDGPLVGLKYTSNSGLQFDFIGRRVNFGEY